MDGNNSADPKQSTGDLTAFVQNLLHQTASIYQARFKSMSDNIVTQIDETGSRIDELELSISKLRAEIGTAGSPPVALQEKQSEESSIA